MTSRGNWHPGNRYFDAAFSQVQGSRQLSAIPHRSGEAPLETAAMEPGVSSEYVWRGRHDTPIERPAPAIKRTKEMAGDPLAVRKAMVRARFNSVANMIERTPRVRVSPKNDDIRRSLYHPVGRIGFSDHGSVEWPLDAFTQRRIRDGSVTVEGEVAWGAAHPLREATNWQARQQWDATHKTSAAPPDAYAQGVPTGQAAQPARRTRAAPPPPAGGANPVGAAATRSNPDHHEYERIRGERPEPPKAETKT